MEHVEKAAEAIQRADELRSDLVTMLRTDTIVAETEIIDLERVATKIVVPESTRNSAVACSIPDFPLRRRGKVLGWGWRASAKSRQLTVGRSEFMTPMYLTGRSSRS